ncbi:MAG: hypothetical protein KatS3mg068_0725 [Candidatus Sericytochromatia bacterium]|nr:MAG: hypothetical protein KatS3mg068_0725 [Candidatus Sericytochromatia bacterium]
MYFKDSQHLEDVLYNFFIYLINNTDIGDKLLTHKVKIRFNYTEPNLFINIDCSKNKVEVSVNNNSFEPEIELFMNADIAHKFWLGKVNLVMAVTKQEIKVKGSFPKLLLLLPIITPAYKIYPKYLKEKGFENLLL